MALPFVLGDVTELFVEEPFEGFDRPETASLVRILGDGSSYGNEVMQQGPIPLRQAQMTGWLYDAGDVELCRQYAVTKAGVIFTWPEGAEVVRLMELSTKYHSGRWAFSVTLVADEPEGS